MKQSLSLLFSGVTLGSMLLASAGTASAAQIRVVSANPVEAGIHELAEQFERDTGNEVTVEVMGTGAINRLLASDEPADVVIGTTASIAQAAANGEVAGDNVHVARVGIGVIVRSGASIPNVATVDGLRQAALGADALVYNTAGSGRYVDRMLGELGIGEQVTAKSARPGNGAQTMERIIEGTGAELGFGLLSEIKPYEGNGIQLVGRLPEDIQNYTVYEGVVLERSTFPGVSKDFIDFLTTAAAREVFAATGVD